MPTSLAETRKHRSVSQIKQYERCPYSYFLARIEKVWQRPAAWLPQGSAVHEAAEAFEKSGRAMTLEEAQTAFSEAYSREVGKYTDVTPNLEYWFRSGPYAGEQDIERRYGIGLGQVEKYLSWYENNPHEVIWIAPDGTPGIELAFDIDLDGVLVRGYIDAIVAKEQAPDLPPVLTVRDNKTGNNPGDDFQLAVYAVALEQEYGIDRPVWGDYWMGRSGKPTYPYDLTEWTREKVAAKFHELEANIQAERFDPKPDPNVCGFCDVALSCEYRA